MKAHKTIRMKALFCAFILFQVAVLAAQTISPQILHPDLLHNLEKSKYPFYHGVAIAKKSHLDYQPVRCGQLLLELIFQKRC
jgi:hypothetical protein